MSFTRNFFALGLIALAVLLTACSGGESAGQPRSGTGPSLQLFLIVDGNPVSLATSGVVGVQPIFELRVSDRTVVESVQYRIDEGTWQSVELNSLSRAVFTPHRPLSGDSAKIEVRATNASGATRQITANLRVDSVAPEITLFELDTTDYTDGVIPEFSVIQGQSSSIRVRAVAADGAAGEADVELVLKMNSETMYSSSGGNLDYVIDTASLDLGVYRFLVYALDSVGNRSDEYDFVVRVGSAIDEQPPTVTIVSPADGAQVPIGTSVSVLVDLEVNSGGVGDVFVTLAGEHLTSTDGHVFTGTAPTTPGEHVLAAWATSGGTLGLRSQTVVQSFTTTDEAPVVTILSPGEGRQYAAGSVIEVFLDIRAGAGGIGDSFVTVGSLALSSTDGRIFRGTIPTGFESGEYQILAWSETTADSPTISAIATSTITVSNTAPEITIVNPAAGREYLPGDAIIVAVSAIDTGGGVGDVSLTFDGTEYLPNTPIRGPGIYEFELTAPMVLNHYFVGASGSSLSGALANYDESDLAVVADLPMTPPTIEISTPEVDHIFAGGDEILVTLDITDRGGGIGDVFVTLDGAPLTQIDEYTFSIAAPEETANFELRAWSYSDDESHGGPVQSDVAYRRIWVDDTPPVVTIVGPPYGTSVTNAFTVVVQADDFGSSVTEILVQATGAAGIIDVGVITRDMGIEEPLEFLANLPPGDTYTLTARATDLVGNQSFSLPVPVTVAP